jgi:DNA-directed RNA polymerase alpha subunit
MTENELWDNVILVALSKTVSAEEAIECANKVIDGRRAKFADEVDDDVEPVHITSLSLSTRARNSLLAGGVKTVVDLMRMTPGELLQMPGLGELTLQEVQAKIAELRHRSTIQTPQHYSRSEN